MANQAAKKAQKNSESLSTKLQIWIIPINIIYFLWTFVWHYSSITTWTVIGSIFLVGTTYFTYSWVVAGVKEGGTSEYAMDVLLVTLAVQVGLLYSSNFWYLYLVIPGYILYLSAGTLKQYIFTPDATPTPEQEAAAEKRKLKKERQAARGHYKRG